MSLDIDSIRVFVRVAELRSFTHAARQLGMPKARASAHVQKLEAELGAQLLQRSTRLVRVTPEGEQLQRRARGFLAEAEEIGALFQAGRKLRGRVRVALPIVLAREFVIPRIPALLAQHPHLELDISASDRVAPALRDGFDLVLRVGPTTERALVGRRIGELPMMNLASPSYLRQYGTPRSLADLRDHLVVMRSVLTVDNVDAYVAACVAGLGIVQVPRHGRGRAEDVLVEILPEFTARPLAVALLHTHGRSVPRRVRAVMTWLTDLVTPTIGQLRKAR